MEDETKALLITLAIAISFIIGIYVGTGLPKLLVDIKVESKVPNEIRIQGPDTTYIYRGLTL
jgi:hypothetical protein